MNAETCFVDTNVLVYVFDDDSPRKQETARQLLSAPADRIVLSFDQLRVVNPFRGQELAQ